MVMANCSLRVFYKREKKNMKRFSPRQVTPATETAAAAEGYFKYFVFALDLWSLLWILIFFDYVNIIIFLGGNILGQGEEIAG